jgi:hypothetical protein
MLKLLKEIGYDFQDDTMDEFCGCLDDEATKFLHANGVEIS